MRERTREERRGGHQTGHTLCQRRDEEGKKEESANSQERDERRGGGGRRWICHSVPRSTLHPPHSFPCFPGFLASLAAWRLPPLLLLLPHIRLSVSHLSLSFPLSYSRVDSFCSSLTFDAAGRAQACQSLSLSSRFAASSLEDHVDRKTVMICITSPDRGNESSPSRRPSSCSLSHLSRLPPSSILSFPLNDSRLYE